ncbi:hypothetical protein [Bradyrhizobium sp. USDA 4520]
MMNFDRFCGLLSATVLCLTLAIASWSGIVGPIWRASYSATPDQWLGFAGSLVGAFATLLAAGIALFAAYKTLKPMRDQLSQLVRQNDQNLYDGLRKRAAELLAERRAIEAVVAKSGLVEFAMNLASQPKPDKKGRSGFEKLIEKFQADVEEIHKMRASIWGASHVQADRGAFVDQCLSMSDDLGMTFYELKLDQKDLSGVLTKHVVEWRKSRALLVKSGDKVVAHVITEMNRISKMIAELEARLLTK